MGVSLLHISAPPHMLAHDLTVLRAMAAELPDYLLSGVLFWQMQAGSGVPKLSLGAMLLTRARLAAAGPQLTAAQQAELDLTSRDLEAELVRWPAAAENKAAQELRSRVNLWQAFLRDCQESPDACTDNYSHEVNQRVLAALLLRRFPRLADSPEARRLAPLDVQLRRRLKTGAFILPAEFQAGFPQSEFWFLYGQIG